MLRDRGGRELILGMYWDYAPEEWTNRSEGRFRELHAVSAVAVDWDADGDLDLVAGTAEGDLVRWTNLGTAREPKFEDDARDVPLGDTTFDLDEHYAMPEIADWDQDGLWDLVVGFGDGSVRWARNAGRAGAPRFDALEVLVEPAREGAERSGESVQVCVADLDGDGLGDLLVGDNHQEQIGAALDEAQSARMRELQTELGGYATELEALFGDDEAAKAALDPERAARARAALEEHQELAPDFSSHGYVWFYRRVVASERP